MLTARRYRIGYWTLIISLVGALGVCGYGFYSNYHEPDRLEQRVFDKRAERAQAATKNETARVTLLTDEIREAKSDLHSTNRSLTGLAIMIMLFLIVLVAVIYEG